MCTGPPLNHDSFCTQQLFNQINSVAKFIRVLFHGAGWQINKIVHFSQTDYIVIFFLLIFYITDGNGRYNVVTILDSNGFRLQPCKN